MKILEFYKELELHDWFHMFSDDSKVDKRGHSNYNRLVALTAGKPDFEKMMEEYEKFIWNAGKEPKISKPERPKED